MRGGRRPFAVEEEAEMRTRINARFGPFQVIGGLGLLLIMCACCGGLYLIGKGA